MTTPPPSRARRYLRAIFIILLSLVGLAVTLGTLYIAWIIWLLMSGQAWNEGENIRDLSNGLYVYQSPDGVWICRDPHATLVVPSSHDVTTSSMAVLDRLVVGYAENRVGSGMHVGYFILDTRTDEVIESLSEDAWLDELKERGVASPPVLLPPPGN